MKKTVILLILICLVISILPSEMLIDLPVSGDVDPSPWTKSMKVVDDNQSQKWLLGKNQNTNGTELVSGDVDPSLWTKSMKILDNNQSQKWWLGKNQNTNGTNDWVPTAQLLSEQISQDPSLNIIFTDIFGNPYNNTIFVAITKVDNNTVNQIQRLTDIPKGIHLKVIKSVASKIQLNEWEKFLDLDTLKSKGIFVSSLTKSINGTLVLGLNDTSTDNLLKLTSIIQGKVPTGAIVIKKDVEKQSATTPSTLMGGVGIQSIVGGVLTGSTLGFIVKYGTTTYAIIAGHAADLGGSEITWVDPYGIHTDLGMSIQQPSNQYPNYRYSDSTLVNLTRNAVSRVWLNNGWPDFAIVGKQDYSQQYVGELITHEGQANGYQSGMITEKVENAYRFRYCYWMKNQIHSDFQNGPGDSGGPVFASINGQCYAMGIYHAYDPAPQSWGWYSPCDGIEADYAMSFTWSFPVTYLSDNFQNWPFPPISGMWTYDNTVPGTITQSSDHGHSGSVKVYSPTATSKAYAYIDFYPSYADDDIHFSTYVFIDNSISTTDFNYIFHVFFNNPSIEELGTAYYCSGSTCYLMNRESNTWVNAGAIQPNTWVKIDAYFGYKVGKVAYYINSNYVGQHPSVAPGTNPQPNRLYFGDDSTTSETMYCYFDDMLIDDAQFIQPTTVTYFRESFLNYPNNPTYVSWTSSVGSPGSITAHYENNTSSLNINSPSAASYAYTSHSFSSSTGLTHFALSFWIDSSVIPTDYNYLLDVYDAPVSHELLACGYYKDSNGYWYLRIKDGGSWPQWGMGPLPRNEWVRLDAFYDINTGKTTYYLNGGSLGQYLTNNGGTGYIPGMLYIGDKSSSGQTMKCYITDLLIDEVLYSPIIDNYESFPTGWTRQTGGSGQVTQEQYPVFQGTYSGRFSAPTTSDYAFGYRAIQGYSSHNFHIQIHFWVDSATTPSLIFITQLSGASGSGVHCRVVVNYESGVCKVKYLKTTGSGYDPASYTPVSNVAYNTWHVLDLNWDNTHGTYAISVDGGSQANFQPRDTSVTISTFCLGDSSNAGYKGLLFFDNLLMGLT